jgi:hypothetical protein
VIRRLWLRFKQRGRFVLMTAREAYDAGYRKALRDSGEAQL